MEKEIALIIPNNPFLINEKVFPNIGLLRVATQLRNEGHNVDVLDFSGKKPEEIIPYAHQYRTFGFTSTTPEFPYAIELLRYLKQENQEAKTIIGGAHASALYQLRQKGIADKNIGDLEVFDTIFSGEGEDTTNMFKPGWQKGRVIKDIEQVSIPDREFLDIRSYHYSIFGKDTTCITTQRGCPYQCGFCSGRDIEMYNHIRFHSPSRVLEEMDELNEKYGYTSFMWYDDEINLNIGRLEILCKELSKRDYQHRGFVRSNLIVKHPESVKWLKEAGFVKICSGVESGSDRMLESVNKKITVEMNTEARQLFRDAGIHYEAFAVMGFPGETLGDIMKTYQWLKENKPDDFDLNLITPYPGSIIYDHAVPSAKFKDYNWEFNGLYFNKPKYSREDSFYKGLARQSHSDVRTDELSNEDLKRLRDSIDGELREILKPKLSWMK
jgi:radical SAM superfamily enzyme YgiQ (UPF0313 family)